MYHVLAVGRLRNFPALRRSCTSARLPFAEPSPSPSTGVARGSAVGASVLSFKMMASDLPTGCTPFAKVR